MNLIDIFRFFSDKYFQEQSALAYLNKQHRKRYNTFVDQLLKYKIYNKIMDLLANLIAYSSIAPSEGTDKKEERSQSAYGRFSLETNTSNDNTQKVRVSSKSLSKMNLFSNKQIKIDPKQRCLHRLSHIFNKKFQKHYFAFFVILETMKSKNIFLQDRSTSLKQKQKIEQGVYNLMEIISIIQNKEYEKNFKNKMFKSIKRHSEFTKGIQIIDQIYMTKKNKVYQNRLFSYGKQLQIFHMKAQILATAIHSIDKKSYEKQLLGESFNLILEGLQQQQVENNIALSPLGYKKIKNKALEVSPISVSKKVSNFRDSIQITTFQSSWYPKLHKCCQVLANYEERPYNLEISFESFPKRLNKQIIQELSTSQIGDQYDRSNIFRFKDNKNAFNNLEISSVVGQTFSRIHTMITDHQKSKDPNDLSTLSYTPFIPQDHSTYSIHEKLSESNFGSDAVNFKNSLVLERESMKKNQFQKIEEYRKNNFMKKIIECPNTPPKPQLIQKNYTPDILYDEKKSIKTLNSEGKNQRNMQFNHIDIMGKKLRYNNSDRKNDLSWTEQSYDRQLPVRDSGVKAKKQKYSNQAILSTLNKQFQPSNKFINLGKPH